MARHVSFVVLLWAASFTSASQNLENTVTNEGYPFRDIKLSLEERAKDIVSRLTLDEKVAQVSHGGAEHNGPAPAIERLGIRPYQWGTECISGDIYAPTGPTTGFTQAMGIASTWNVKLMQEVATAIGTEVRAKNNDYSSRGQFMFHTGLSCWSPVVNIFRDGRWGRGQETYGEDPYLTASMAHAYVTGLQGPHPRYKRAIAGCKHYAVHAGPDTYPTSRHKFDAKVSMTDLHVTFLPAFKACVDAGVQTIMCSYNRVNGIPACASKLLLKEILRDRFRFDGYVVSDQDALMDFNTIPEGCPPERECQGHRWVNNYTAASVFALEAGTDLEDASFAANVFAKLGDAVRQGMVKEKLVDTALTRLFRARLRLGEFDPPEYNPYTQLNMSVVDSAEHKVLALRTALQAQTLLINRDNTLPLKKSKLVGKTITLFGPLGNDPRLMFGDYPPSPSTIVTPLEGLKKIFPSSTVNFVSGCPNAFCHPSEYSQHQSEVINAAKNTDVAVIVMGLTELIESEGRDRWNMTLPGVQDVAANLQPGMPLVVVFISAGPVEISEIVDLDRLGALLHTVYPGQAGGDAIAMTISGENNPAGRLAVTWPRVVADIPPITDYTMVGRTYRYAAIPPLFSFGYGLSYARFEYSNLTLSAANVSACNLLDVSVTVTNVGKVAGDEVVQVYVGWEKHYQDMGMPRLQLVNFDRLFFRPHESQTVEFFLSADQMAVFSEQWVIESGTMDIWVGGQQPDQPTSAPSQVIRSSFTVSTENSIKLEKCFADANARRHPHWKLV